MANAHVGKDKEREMEAGVPPRPDEGEGKQLSPGTPVLKPRAEVKDAASQAAWLAEAKEIEAVLLRGDHASPITTALLLLEAIPVIEAYVPPAARGAKKDEDEPHKREK